MCFRCLHIYTESNSKPFNLWHTDSIYSFFSIGPWKGPVLKGVTVWLQVTSNISRGYRCQAKEKTIQNILSIKKKKYLKPGILCNKNNPFSSLKHIRLDLLACLIALRSFGFRYPTALESLIFSSGCSRLQKVSSNNILNKKKKITNLFILHWL